MMVKSFGRAKITLPVLSYYAQLYNSVAGVSDPNTWSYYRSPHNPYTVNGFGKTNSQNV